MTATQHFLHCVTKFPAILHQERLNAAFGWERAFHSIKISPRSEYLIDPAIDGILVPCGKMKESAAFPQS